MFKRIPARSSLSILLNVVVLLALAVRPIPAQEETPPDGVRVSASDGTEAPVSNMHPTDTTTAGTLWSNGPADQVNGVTSIDPPNVGDFTSRTADDFQLPSSCPSYTVSEIRVTMLTDSASPDAYIELYDHSGNGGPVNAPAFVSYPSTSKVDLGWDINGFQAYEYTIPTPGLSLSPGYYWLAAVGIPDGFGLDNAFFATAGNGVIQLDQGYFLSTEFGYPTWTPLIDFLGFASDFAFDIDGYCFDNSYLPSIMNNFVNIFEGPWEDEPNNDWLQANGSLRSGKNYKGYPDEKDYFSFYMRKSGSIAVNLTNHTGQDVQLQLFYQNINNRVAFDPKPPFQIDLANQPSGSYYIYIFSQSGHNQENAYTLQVTYP